MNPITIGDHVRETLRLIESIRMPHHYGALLSSFIIDAVSPHLAAQNRT